MKKSLVAICLSILFITAISSCKRKTITGEGESGSVTRNVAGFTRIDVSTEIEVIVRVGSGAESSVVLDGYKNITSNIQTEVKDNTLRIFTQPRLRFESDKDIVATVTVPALTYLGLSGKSDSKIEGDIISDNLELRISGMGDMIVGGHTRVGAMKLQISGAGNMVMNNVEAGKMEAHLSGLGDLKVKGGNAGYADLSISGAGEIDAHNLICKTAKIKVSGIGNVLANVQEKMDVHISGAGDVRYKGHPAITKHITGVGDIDDNN